MNANLKFDLIYAERMADANKSMPNSTGAPHLEVLDRVKNIPVIHSAIEKTGSTYSYVKDSHHLVNWALNQAEAGLNYATATAAPLAAPLAKKFEGHISAVDQKLCEGLDIVEQKVPIVKKPPEQVTLKETCSLLIFEQWDSYVKSESVKSLEKFLLSGIYLKINFPD